MNVYHSKITCQVIVSLAQSCSGAASLYLYMKHGPSLLQDAGVRYAHCLAAGCLIYSYSMIHLTELRIIFSSVFASLERDFPLCEMITFSVTFGILAVRHFLEDVISSNCGRRKNDETEGNMSDNKTNGEQSTLGDTNIDVHNQEMEDKSLIPGKSSIETSSSTYGSTEKMVKTNGQNGEEISTDLETKVTNKRTFLKVWTIILWVGFSISKFTEGLVFGTQTNAPQAWIQMTNMVPKNCVLVIVVGLNAFVNFEGTSPWKVAIPNVTVFTGSVICGAATGIFFLECSLIGRPFRFLTAILQSLSGGMVLYMSIFELLTKEFAPNNGTTLKALVVILGFTSMSLLQLLFSLLYDRRRWIWV